MSVQGWNPSTYVNAHRLSVQGGEHSRSNGSGLTLLACRICDKIFLSTPSLIQHYQSHEDELARARQQHQRTNFASRVDTPVVTSNTFQTRISPSPITSSPQQQQQQQRYHPYFPNGYGARTRPITNPNANNPKFLAPTQTPNLLPRQTAAPGPTNGIATATNSAISRTRNDPILAASAKMVEQKGFDQTVDKRTAWFLWQLEKPIPKIIDLEVQDEKYEGCNLELTLKI